MSARLSLVARAALGGGESLPPGAAAAESAHSQWRGSVARTKATEDRRRGEYLKRVGKRRPRLGGRLSKSTHGAGRTRPTRPSCIAPDSRRAVGRAPTGLRPI